MDLESRLTIPPHVMSRLVGEETVVLDLASGMYFGLDRVGRLIWESVSEGRTLGQAAKTLTETYDVDAEQARADVLSFAGELVENGLLAE